MIECKRNHAFDAPCALCFPDDAKCALCGEDHDYEDHKPGSELRHEFEPERLSDARVEIQRLKAHGDGLAATSEALLADLRIRAEAAEEQRDHEFAMSEWFRACAARWKAFAKSLYRQRVLWETQVNFALDVINAEARAEAAEADAALAWRRVTELQALSTRQVEENRSLRSGIAATAKVLRGWIDVRNAGLPAPGDNALRSLAERLEAIP